jgi:hypothetical protein
MATEHILEPSQQGGSRLHPGRNPYTPHTAERFNPTVIKPQKTEGLVLGKVHCAGLVQVHLNIKLLELI